MSAAVLTAIATTILVVAIMLLSWMTRGKPDD